MTQFAPPQTQTDAANSREYTERVIPFTAGDGMELNLINIRGAKPPTRSPVLLVHGAGVSANIFRAPVELTLIDVLVAQGYDVWLENWRASIIFPPNLWTLDQAAINDHPKAVEKVVEETGHEKIKAVIHCQGSTSFTMSAIAGLIPQVDTIISNAVSLNPIVPWWSDVKLKCAVPFVQLFTKYFGSSGKSGLLVAKSGHADFTEGVTTPSSERRNQHVHQSFVPCVRDSGLPVSGHKVS